MKLILCFISSTYRFYSMFHFFICLCFLEKINNFIKIENQYPENSNENIKKTPKLVLLAKETSTAGLGALLHENNHGYRRASAFTYLLLIWIGLFKLRLSVSDKSAFVAVKYVMRVHTSTAFTSKVLSFPVLREHIENVVSKFQDNWSKIERAEAFWKKNYQGFILIENFNLKTTFSKSMDAISQKIMHWSVWKFSDLFDTYLACVWTKEFFFID